MYRIETEYFGLSSKTYRLKNARGMQVVLTDFGARIVQILLPVEEDGSLRNICLTRHSAEDYQTTPYIGATVAPVAGRLFSHQVAIDGKVLDLTENGPGFSLHSGPQSASMQIWACDIFPENNQLVFRLTLEDGYNVFPGPIHLTATYTLTEDNCLEVRYKGVSPKKTLFNPTNHVFFNLTGHFFESIKDHQFQISASRVVVYDENGKGVGIRQVADSPYDFNRTKRIGQALQEKDEQLALLGGFDNCWILDRPHQAASITSPDGKIGLSVATNQDGLIIYTYNHNNPALAIKQGVFSLECLASMEQSHIIEAQEEGESWTRYTFDY